MTPLVDGCPLTFTVPGRPVVWQRVGRRAGGHAYVPLEVLKAENAIASYLMAEAMRHGRALPLPMTGPVSVACTFRYKTPRSKTILDAPITRSTGDLDNLAKTVLDGMSKWVGPDGNPRLWRDDSQVVVLVCRAEYSDREETEVRLWHRFVAVHIG